jgi:prepilin-type N-terminal cleavage/methylation domain-containing protein
MATHGFTLVEVVMVLVVAGLLMALALPKFTELYRGQATITAADQFVRAHELARAVAVRYERVTEFHIDAATQRFWVVVDTSGTGVRDTVGPIHSVSEWGVQMTSTDTLMCIDGRGLPSTTNSKCQGAAGTVVFTLGGRADTVVITTLGKLLR